MEEKRKTRVFMTGATGVMGSAGVSELMKYPENYELTILVRPSKRNKKKISRLQKRGPVNVIWGDMLQEEALRRGIENADIVLHVGGMVSPEAEHYPEKTLKVNVGSMELIAGIAKEIEESEPGREVKVVYIGSVSQYGSKLPPNHWGDVSLPPAAAKGDAYAESKIKAEEALRKAGLNKWVSLRQTAILHGGLLLKVNDPVVFHVPLNGVLEWITTEDSGRLLERVCRKEVPEDFWCKVYNLGGGEPFRLINIEFEREILKALGCPPPEKIFEPNWFAAENFHGIWFSDSDKLDSILHFREPDTFKAALTRLKKSLPFYYSLTPIVPAFLIKTIMRRVASRPGLGPLSWIKENNEERIKAAWGSREAYDRIGTWKDYREPALDRRTPSS